MCRRHNQSHQVGRDRSKEYKITDNFGLEWLVAYMYNTVA